MRLGAPVGGDLGTKAAIGAFVAAVYAGLFLLATVFADAARVLSGATTYPLYAYAFVGCVALDRRDPGLRLQQRGDLHLQQYLPRASRPREVRRPVHDRRFRPLSGLDGGGRGEAGHVDPAAGMMTEAPKIVIEAAVEEARRQDAKALFGRSAS